MFRPLLRPIAAAAILAIASSAAQAQLFNRGCSSCGGGAPAPMMSAPMSYGYGGYGGMFDSCGTCAPPVAINPCAVCAPPVAMQPVTQTVYREMPVTKYRPVQKTVQKPVMRTVYEERPVTAYRQVMETKTVDVPTTAYQQVTECKQCVANRGQWQTSYQRVPKMSPCQYDPNPTLLGWMHRNAYSMRMALTPNFTRQRQYVPNMVAYSVPVTRTVAVPTTRQVTYNVARLEPYQSTQTVAVNKVEYVDTAVTAYEPYTEMQTVAVGTHTTYAFVDPINGSSTATALAPVPDTQIRSRTAAVPTPAGVPAAAAPATNPPAASATDDLFKPLSHPQTHQPAPEPTPTYFDARHQQESPTPVTASVATNDGWRASRTAVPTATIAARPVAATEDVEVVIAARK
jgi:hypothetical protein